MNDTSDILTVGVIGAGVIGQEHMQWIADIDCMRLGAVMDIDAERAGVYAEQYGAKPYATLEDLMGDPLIDAVHVCTPHTYHLQPTLAAAEAGKHVLLEKPMALALSECDQMITACEAADSILMVEHPLRYDPAYKHVKELIAKRVVGDVGHIMLRWYEYFDTNRPDNPYGSWYLDGHLGGICILHTFGPHVFDILPWFMDSSSYSGLRTRQ